MSTGEVVGSVFFTADELLRVEELTVSTGSDLVDHSGLKVDEDCTWDVFPCAGLAEEGVESIVTSSNGLVTRHLSIRLYQIQIPKRNTSVHKKHIHKEDPQMYGL